MNCKQRIYYAIVLILGLLAPISLIGQPYLAEHLNRGMVGIPVDGGMYLSWRMLYEDKQNTFFDIYRIDDNGKELKLNDSPIKNTTDFFDSKVDWSINNRWSLRLNNNEVASWTFPKNKVRVPYISIPIDRPEGGEIAGISYHYQANDASIGDLDGDGEYEIVLKWNPSNAKNPPQRGLSGNTFLDAYKLNGQKLWRIDLGHNIRSGAATTNFLVFDFDMDGKAEICCKTADGTVDGEGHVLGDKDVDWRTLDKDSPTYGKIVKGPEFLTVFDGETGRALDSHEYIPTRYPLDGWGGIGGNCGNDNTGGRSDRFSACVALLDGKTPSPVMIRGWYGRTVVVAWTFVGKKLRPLWTFDSACPGYEGYSGMANHGVTVADFDGDGFDEICVGAMTVDHNGNGLYTTGLRHGDAMHVGKLIPSRKGIQVFGVHENEGNHPIVKKTPALAMFDGATGHIIWQDGFGKDAGRGVAANIDPRFDGAECWCNYGGLRRGDTGEIITSKKPSSCNFNIYWDADSLSELLDHTSISKWNWITETTDLVMKAEGVVSNNGTKGNPCLSGDILGDWREEVIWADENQKELRIYVTTVQAENKRVTLMNDRQYRLAIAWQNVAYNQPPHTSY